MINCSDCRAAKCVRVHGPERILPQPLQPDGAAAAPETALAPAAPEAASDQTRCCATCKNPKPLDEFAGGGSSWSIALTVVPQNACMFMVRSAFFRDLYRRLMTPPLPSKHLQPRIPRIPSLSYHRKLAGWNTRWVRWMSPALLVGPYAGLRSEITALRCAIRLSTNAVVGVQFSCLCFGSRRLMLRGLFSDNTERAKLFRANIRAYNGALAFTSTVYRSDTRLAAQNFVPFQI